MVLQTLSICCGWLYTLSWGLGMYPPVITNIKLWSVQGLSFDFICFNTFGYVLYTLYYGFLRYSNYIKEEYGDRYSDPNSSERIYPLIKTNDFIFAMHGLVLNTILFTQVFFWKGMKTNDNQKISIICKIILSLVVLYSILGSILIIETNDTGNNFLNFQWLDLLTSLGLIKIIMSVCKNIPQTIYNYNRKSTHGWPIEMIWLDFFGAVFSFAQLVIDSYLTSGDLSHIFNNLPKFLLSLEVAISDTIFFLQHYVWYYNNDIEKFGEYNSLLQEEERFLIEHEHDHDHMNNNTVPSSNSSSTQPDLETGLLSENNNNNNNASKNYNSISSTSNVSSPIINSPNMVDDSQSSSITYTSLNQQLTNPNSCSTDPTDKNEMQRLIPE
ncbi:hypothetical protein B5S28_g1255 [[Candida] boidinii]|nr:hypothetical protein B5S28_g1255 [[Candida] boidinii]OWB60919.1 hypothetical protein B5S29_g1802 [[Candida] boidinii]